MSIAHQETIELQATPAQVRQFIMTPERILDYYPLGLEGGEFEPGRAYWCSSEMGVSLLEMLPNQCSDDLVVIKVTTAIGLEAPFTRESIEAAAAFTMIEDWALTSAGSGTTLLKTWRDIEMAEGFDFPIADGLVENAKHETDALVEGWNRAARL